MGLLILNQTLKLDFITMDVSEKNTALVFSLILAILVTIFGPPLIFGIIWFERFGSDKKRTLLNMFVNMNCWTTIAFILLGQLPKIVIYTVGPLQHSFCYIHTVVRQSLICSILMYIDAIIVFRYIYIFKLRNPVAFNNEFWCLFVSVWIHTFNFILMVSANILSNYQSLSNFICTGKVTGLPHELSGKGAAFFAFSSAIIHFVINLKIYIYKRSFKDELISHKMSSKALDWKNLEKTSFPALSALSSYF